jgi:hypothetical protein
MTNELRDGLALALCRKQCSLPGMTTTCECPDPASDPEYPICIQWLSMADACIAFLRWHFAWDEVVERAAEAARAVDIATHIYRDQYPNIARIVLQAAIKPK